MTEIDYCCHIYFFVINEIDQVRVVFNQMLFVFLFFFFKKDKI